MEIPQPDDRVKLCSFALHDQLRADAAAAPRGRTNFNFHPALSDNPHRFLNVMTRGTYITPHRHTEPPKAETFLILEGLCAFFIFDDAGEVQDLIRLDGLATHSAAQADRQRGAYGVDIAPGVWHTLVVLSDSAVCFEVKPGPFVPASDKEFAPWAPREGHADCADYLATLVDRATV